MNSTRRNVTLGTLQPSDIPGRSQRHQKHQRTALVPMMLTDAQRSSLNRAICDYVRQNAGSETLVEELQRVLECDFGQEQDPRLLEKKWNSIVRLQASVLELEKNCAELQTALKEAEEQKSEESGIADASKEWYPRDLASFHLRQDAAVTAVCLHPSLPVVYVGLGSGKLLRYDLLSTELPLQSAMAHIDGITSISISAPGPHDRPSYLATASKDMSCKVWEIEKDSNFTHVRTLVGHEHTVSECQFFEKGADLLLATCSRDMYVKIWDLSNGWCIKSFQPHTQWIRSIHIHGEYCLTGSNDSAIRLTHWPSANGLSMGIDHEFPVEKVRILIPASTDDILPQYKPLGFQHVASASRDGTVRIWKVSLPKFIPHRPPRPNPLDTTFKVSCVLRDHTSWVRDIRQFNDKLFSCSDDGTIKCWDLSWKELQSTSCIKSWDLSEHGFVNCLCMDNITFKDFPLRKLLIAGSNDGTLTCFMK